MLTRLLGYSVFVGFSEGGIFVFCLFSVNESFSVCIKSM